MMTCYQLLSPVFYRASTSDLTSWEISVLVGSQCFVSSPCSSGKMSVKLCFILKIYVNYFYLVNLVLIVHVHVRTDLT